MPLTKRKLERVDVDVGVEVYVKSFNGRLFAEAAELMAGVAGKDQLTQMEAMAKVCVLAICDAEGEPLFESPEEVLEEDWAFFEACAETALRVNGLGEDDSGNS